MSVGNCRTSAHSLRRGATTPVVSNAQAFGSINQGETSVDSDLVKALIVGPILCLAIAAFPPLGVVIIPYVMYKAATE
jgi:hypothetical protein